MNRKIIDTHIHLEQYSNTEIKEIMNKRSKYFIDGLITVSKDYQSSIKNLELARSYENVFPAFGYHPEQDIPSRQTVEKLFSLMDEQKETMVAVGEVGLPYYLKRNNKQFFIEPYIDLLDEFMKKAIELDKPIILHAIYEDAMLVLDMLEKHHITKAHFHWFKGDRQVVERMIANNYYISITPDCLYEEKIMQLIKMYPLSLMMVETDGPWKFKKAFQDKMTHPKMIHKTINQIATIKKIEEKYVYEILYENSYSFYNLSKYKPKQSFPK